MPLPEWTTRTIDAPAGDLLTATEVARLLGVSEDTLKRLISEGEFPSPLLIGKQTQVWDWEAIAYYRLRIRFASRMAESKPTATGGKPTATGGKPTASE